MLYEKNTAKTSPPGPESETLPAVKPPGAATSVPGLSSLFPPPFSRVSAPDPIPAQPQTAQPQTENRKQETENYLLKMWEKSGKLPGNTPSPKDNSEQYQLDLFEEKNAGKNQKLWRPGASTGPEETAYAKSLGAPVRRKSEAPPAAKISTATDLEHETPPDGELQRSWQSESLFQKLRRKWAKTGKAPKYSCNYNEIYEQYLKDIEPVKIADDTATGAPGLSSLLPCPRRQPRLRESREDQR